jgi:hypothetical protein
VKVLRSDGVGEYDSREFVHFCKHHGIKEKMTTRYTPQQSRVVERNNCTIMSMARTLLTTRKFSKNYWAKAVACSFYILNRSPTSSVQGKVPKEKWSGSKVNVSHFKKIGCIFFSHVPEETRKKLDDRSEKYICMGYSENLKAYILYNHVNKKFLVSRDVKFMKDKSWDEMEKKYFSQSFFGVR